MIQKPKGCEDFFPSDMRIRNSIFDSLRTTAARYGYKEVSSPAFEQIDLLTKKEGEEIKKQIFTLDKRGKESFGLRFDLTVPMTRMFGDIAKSTSKPVRWFGLDRMWRYERPQQGRLREFYQLSVELFGAGGIAADAEVISLALDCLIDLGLTQKDIVLKLNDRRILQTLLLKIVSKDRLEDVIRVIDKKSKISNDEFVAELKKIGIGNPAKIEKMLKTPLSEISEASDIKKMISLLGDKKKFIEFDLSTARGLVYYTGIVFEIFDKSGKYRSILGGGRYDNMVGLFGGPQTPATGFGLGYATLLLLLKEKNLLKSSEDCIGYFIGAVSEDDLATAMNIASGLRDKNSVIVDVMGRNISGQLKFANKIGAQKVIIIGETERKKKQYSEKDMKTGKEKKVRF